MSNKLFSFFNRGTINQNNTTIMSTTVVTLISSIRNCFFEGRISEAIQSLNEAKQEHEQHNEAKYQLLILETEFFLLLQRFDKANEKLNYLEKNFLSLLSGAFYEMKATLLSLKKNDIEYWKCIEILKHEFITIEIKNEYFEIIFYLNSGNIQEAQKIFNNTYTQNTPLKELDKQAIFLGVQIYSTLALQSNNNLFFTKAQECFHIYLQKGNVNYFEHLEISNLNSTEALNKYFQNIDYDKTIFQKFSELLEKIQHDYSFFSDNYKNALQNRQLHCYYFTNKPKFYTYYLKFNELDKDLINFVHFQFKEPDIQKIDAIKKRVIEKKEPELLIRYLEYLSIDQPNQVTSFLKSNPNFLQNNKAFHIYTDVLIKHNPLSLNELIKESSKRQHLTDIDALTFLKLQQYQNSSLTQEQIKHLFKIQQSADEKILISQLTLDLLGKNNQSQLYLSIGVELQDFSYLLDQTLRICINDSILRMNDFEAFLKKIHRPINDTLVGYVFLKFEKLRASVEYFSKGWKENNLSNANKISIASTVLHHSLQYFLINNRRDECRITPEQCLLFRGFLEEQYSQCTLSEIVILAHFMIVIESSFDKGFLYLNQQLLNTNLDKLSEQEKTLLSELYFEFILNEKKLPNNIPTNLVLKNKNKLIVNKSQYPRISSSYCIKQLDPNNFELIKHDSSYDSFSLFHQICKLFIHSIKTNTFRSISISLNDPMSSIKPFLIQNSESQKQKFKVYFKGNAISFHQLVGEYKAYFDLIPHLLESKKTLFDTGQSLIIKNCKKILTLSSIIFLNNLKELEGVLKRHDIYIQQTTIDWLSSFIDELDKTDKIMTLFSVGGGVFRNIRSKNDLQHDKENLIKLAKTIIDFSEDRIIYDRDEILDFVGATHMLAPEIGIQEYRALSFAYNHNYQIISEDRIFYTLANELKLNPIISSNSMSLINFKLKIENNNLQFYKNLHQQGYRPLFDKQIIINFIASIVEKNTNLAATIKNNDALHFIIFIAKEYNWLDFLEQFYEIHYKFYIPMRSAPPKDLIAKNIEILLKY